MVLLGLCLVASLGAADSGVTAEQALGKGIAAEGRRFYAPAEKWLKIARDMGNLQAEYELGHLYYFWYVDHLGRPSDCRKRREAVSLIRKAAEKGYVPAETMLGHLLMAPDGCQRANRKEGRAWLEKAASQGDARAAKELGLLKGSK